MKLKIKSSLPLWKLEDGITQSMLGEFLSCRRKATLSYKKGLSSQYTSNAITFGSLFHAALEQIYQTDAIVVYDKLIDSLLKDYKKEVSKERIWTFEDEENQVLNEGYLKILIPAYIDHYRKIDNNKTWFYIEKEFKNKWVSNIVLRGKYDRICRSNGEIWIYDTKTKSRIDPEIQNRLSFDLQIMFYMLNYSLEFDKTPVGFVYDQIKRPALRKGSQETMKKFMQRVEASIDDSYFQRIRVPIGRGELVRWIENEFTPMIEDFVNWATGKSVDYRNPSACETRYGNCKFLRWCGTADKTGLYRKKKIFSELEMI